jgi:hypothetical protein
MSFAFVQHFPHLAFHRRTILAAPAAAGSRHLSESKGAGILRQLEEGFVLV